MITMGALRKAKISGTILAGIIAVIAVLALSGYEEPQLITQSDQQSAPVETVVKPMIFKIKSTTQPAYFETNNVDPIIQSQSQQPYFGSQFLLPTLNSALAIGLVTDNDAYVTTYTLPTANANPAHIAVETDCKTGGECPRLFITYGNSAKVAHLTPNDNFPSDGGSFCSGDCPDPTVKEWNIPSGSTTYGIDFAETNNGSDGDVIFFTEPDAPGRIGMLDASSNDITEWSLSGTCPNSPSDCEPRGLQFLDQDEYGAQETNFIAFADGDWDPESDSFTTGNTEGVCWAERLGVAVGCLLHGDDFDFGTADDEIIHWDLSGLGISGSNQPYDIVFARYASFCETQEGDNVFDAMVSATTDINCLPSLIVISDRSPNPPAIIEIIPFHPALCYDINDPDPDNEFDNLIDSCEDAAADIVKVWIAPSGTGGQYLAWSDLRTDDADLCGSCGNLATDLLYFAADNKIVRFDRHTDTFTEWTIPSGAFAGAVEVLTTFAAFEVAETDQLFFNIESNGQGIGRLDPATGFFTEWATGSNGQGIAINKDLNQFIDGLDTSGGVPQIYFADTANDEIIKICHDDVTGGGIFPNDEVCLFDAMP